MLAVGLLDGPRSLRLTMAPDAQRDGELGSSSAIVCTPSVDVGALATDRSAVFQQLPEVRNHYRPA